MIVIPNIPVLKDLPDLFRGPSFPPRQIPQATPLGFHKTDLCLYPFPHQNSSPPPLRRSITLLPCYLRKRLFSRLVPPFYLQTDLRPPGPLPFLVLCFSSAYETFWTPFFPPSRSLFSSSCVGFLFSCSFLILYFCHLLPSALELGTSSPRSPSALLFSPPRSLPTTFPAVRFLLLTHPPPFTGSVYASYRRLAPSLFVRV